MYQVYSSQKPGRPVWSIVTSAILLLVTVALAFWLVRSRSGNWDVSLAERRLYRDGMVSVQLPEGWTELPAGRPRLPGLVVAARPDVAESRQGDQFMVFRGVPEPTCSPSYGVVFAVLSMDAASSGKWGPLGGRGPGSLEIAGLPGWMLTLRSGEEPIRFCLGGAAIAPAGQVVGALLELDRVPRAGDYRLFQRLCRGIELPELVWSDAPEAVMERVGIRFDLPGGVRCLQNDDESLPRIQLMGGPGPDVWHLDIHRIPILPGRVPADLAGDRLLDTSHELGIGQQVRAGTIGGHETASGHVAIASEDVPSLFVMVAQVEDQTGLMMIGRHDPDCGGELVELCERIVRTAVVRPYGEVADVNGALQRGRAHLEALAGGELDRAFEAMATQPGVYAHRSPARTLGRYSLRSGRLNRDQRQWWQVDGESSLDFGHGLLKTITERWEIRPDGAEHHGRVSARVRGEPWMTYEEERASGGTRVERHLQTKDGSSQTSVPTDPTYACDPLLTIVASRVARGLDRLSVAVTTTGVYAEHRGCVIMTPLGMKTQPGSTLGELAHAVRVQLDYDPVPMIWYFGDDGTLAGMYFDSGSWLERISPDEEISMLGFEPPALEPGAR